MEEKKFIYSSKKKWIYIIVGFLVGIGLSFAFTFMVQAIKNSTSTSEISFNEYAIPLLLDGFSFASIMYLCFGGFAYISYSAGVFDMLVFSFRKFGTSWWIRSSKQNDKMPKTFYDYKMEKANKPVPYYMWLIWDGLALLIITFVFLIIYLANPVLYV